MINALIAEIELLIMNLVRGRNGRGVSAGEVARAFDRKGWREHLELVDEASRSLAKRGLVVQDRERILFRGPALQG